MHKLVVRWRNYPATFVTDVFGIEPDPWQRDALEALMGHGRVAIRACHGPGKTATAAWAIFLFMLTRFPTRVPCTAPTAHQLRDILWAELAKWHARMSPAVKELFRLTTERLEYSPAAAESFAVARTARPENPEALQGFHCEHMLFVIDEASGVDQRIFEVAEGALSEEGAKVLMLGNPTRTSGYFYDAFHRMRKRWYCLRVSAEDSPRVSDEYEEDMRLKYGDRSNVYRVRVLGEFPTADDNAVIPLEHLEAAVGRQISHFGDYAWGLDVARFGDDRTALAKTTANALIEPVQWWQGKDTMQTVGIVVREYDKTPVAERPTAIYVDVIGIGSGVVDRLLEHDLPVVGVNVAESASVSEQFMRLRDELWWETREWFAAGDVTLDDNKHEHSTEFGNVATIDDVIGELALPGYKMTSAGRLQVESKDDMKKRGVRSPDLADAIVLTRYHRFAKQRRVYARSYKRGARERKEKRARVELV